MEIEASLIFRVTFDTPWKSAAVYRWIRTQRFKIIIFVLMVFITVESMSCIHIKQ